MRFLELHEGDVPLLDLGKREVSAARAGTMSRTFSTLNGDFMARGLPIACDKVQQPSKIPLGITHLKWSKQAFRKSTTESSTPQTTPPDPYTRTV